VGRLDATAMGLALWRAAAGEVWLQETARSMIVARKYRTLTKR
jgi:hypothetical protein